jgi:hypothetical protein
VVAAVAVEEEEDEDERNFCRKFISQNHEDFRKTIHRGRT